MEKSPVLISSEAIYQFIYNKEGISLDLYKYLVKKKPKRGFICGPKNRCNNIPERTSIDLRPDFINNRTDFGHFEGDLTFFKGNQSSNLALMVERLSRFTLVIKNESKASIEVAKGMFNSLAKIPKHARKSITLDNGSEFAKHKLLKSGMNINTYFCDPGSPWQKGQVEFTNALLHRFIPKKFNINKLTQAVINKVQNKLNNLPRKCLGYKTPAEVFYQRIYSGVALQS